MPVPIDVSQFIDEIVGTMLDDILKSASPEEMSQLIEELETKTRGGGYAWLDKANRPHDPARLPDAPQSNSWAVLYGRAASRQFGRHATKPRASQKLEANLPMPTSCFQLSIPRKCRPATISQGTKITKTLPMRLPSRFRTARHVDRNRCASTLIGRLLVRLPFGFTIW
jgi:hypothetical protein